MFSISFWYKRKNVRALKDVILHIKSELFERRGIGGKGLRRRGKG